MSRKNEDLFQFLGLVKDQFNSFGASSISLLNKLEKSNFPVYEVVYNPNTQEVVINVALAGYKKADISIEEKESALLISSVKVNEEEKNDSQLDLSGLENQEEKVEEPLVYWTSQKIAKRAFSLEFSVSNFKVSKPAKFEDGLLTVTLSKVQEKTSKVDIE